LLLLKNIPDSLFGKLNGSLSIDLKQDPVTGSDSRRPAKLELTWKADPRTRKALER
jgi:hypothetical protein